MKSFIGVTMLFWFSFRFSWCIYLILFLYLFSSISSSVPSACPPVGLHVWRWLIKNKPLWENVTRIIFQIHAWQRSQRFFLRFSSPPAHIEKMLLNFQFYLLRTSFTFCARQASNIPNWLTLLKVNFHKYQVVSVKEQISTIAYYLPIFFAVVTVNDRNSNSKACDRDKYCNRQYLKERGRGVLTMGWFVHFLFWFCFLFMSLFICLILF